MQTTAIYSNREEDKLSIEALLHLNEFGDSTTEFYLKDTLFAKGYVRIVYGDHGPYIEFERGNLRLTLLSKFNNFTGMLPSEIDAKYYYFWLYPIGFPDVKVYWQIKPVTDLKNAPRRVDGKRSAFNRSEGYADYKRGMYYVDPYTFLGENRVLRLR